MCGWKQRADQIIGNEEEWIDSRVVEEVEEVGEVVERSRGVKSMAGSPV